MEEVELTYTKQGYSYIKCSKEDCLNWRGMAICDDCGKPIQEEVFLICVLGRAYCKKCFKEWERSAHKYEEDLHLQKEKQKIWYQAHGFKIKED